MREDRMKTVAPRNALIEYLMSYDPRGVRCRATFTTSSPGQSVCLFVFTSSKVRFKALI